MAQSGWRLPDDLLKRVRVHCAESGERQNEFVRQALENALAKQPSVHIEGFGSVPADATQTIEWARAKKKPAAKKSPAELPRIAPRHWGKS
jgi:plasmid stability protein